MRALNDAVMRANPDAVFDTGPGLAMFMVNAAALAIGLFMFGSLLIVIGFDEVSHWAWLRLALLLPLAGLCWPWFKRNWPRRFDPKRVPSGLLPESA